MSRRPLTLRQRAKLQKLRAEHARQHTRWLRTRSHAAWVKMRELVAMILPLTTRRA